MFQKTQKPNWRVSPLSDLNGPIFLYNMFYMFVTAMYILRVMYYVLILHAHSPARQQCIAFN